MKTIVLITTGQPSTNPRIVKEADALQKAVFNVTVLYSFFINWASEKDLLLLQEVAWKYKEVGGSLTCSRGLYLCSRIRRIAARTLNRLLGHSFLMLLKDSDIHLKLAGSCDTDMKDYLLTNAAEISNNIHFAEIIQPEHLPTYASKFDVGMALEFKEPLNRNICLTNKNFTYLVAGNAIIFSETDA